MAVLERERSSTKPKLSAEEKLLRRNKNDEDSEEKSQLQNLQAKREAIIKQLVAIKVCTVWSVEHDSMLTTNCNTQYLCIVYDFYRLKENLMLTRKRKENKPSSRRKMR